MKNSLGNNLPILNLYKKKSLKSTIDTQLLYGDTFKVIQKKSGWKKSLKCIGIIYNSRLKTLSR